MEILNKDNMHLIYKILEKLNNDDQQLVICKFLTWQILNNSHINNLKLIIKSNIIKKLNALLFDNQGTIIIIINFIIINYIFNYFKQKMKN